MSMLPLSLSIIDCTLPRDNELAHFTIQAS
jgi:hypothetical protein